MNNNLICDVLKNEYPDIYKSIQDERYIIEYSKYDYFDEIILNGNVIGFISSQNDENMRILNEVYILPEYRNTSLLSDFLINHYILNPNYDSYLRNPSRDLIDYLIKNNLAIKISDNIVGSYIPFIVYHDSFYSNKKIKRFYKTAVSNVSFKSNIYDLKLCSVLFRDFENEYIISDNHFGVCESRKIDDKKYDANKKLKKLKQADLNKAFDVFINNETKIDEFIESTNEMFDKRLDIDINYGSQSQLSESFFKNFKR